jgi:hypothetical protein
MESLLNLPWVMKRTLLDDFYHKELADREGRTPPISSRLITSGFESNVTVGLYCDYCDNAVRPSAFDFTNTTYLGWNQSWLGFALDSFDAEFELEIDLSANAEGDLTLSLLKKSFGFDGVNVDVEFQLYLVATAQAEMSFTAGMNLSVSCHIWNSDSILLTGAQM